MDCRYLFRGAFVWVLFLTACTQEQSGTFDGRTAEETQIRSVVDRYVESINSANAELGRQVWSESDEISFIHPLGHEVGWAQVKQNFYERLMAGTFSTRKLTVKQISIKRQDTAAIAEFYWEFAATWRKDGSPLRTQGRETQVLWKRQGQWRLAHVHYSGMPTSDARQGF